MVAAAAASSDSSNAAGGAAVRALMKSLQPLSTCGWIEALISFSGALSVPLWSPVVSTRGPSSELINTSFRLHLVCWSQPASPQRVKAGGIGRAVGGTDWRLESLAGLLAGCCLCSNNWSGVKVVRVL